MSMAANSHLNLDVGFQYFQDKQELTLNVWVVGGTGHPSNSLGY